MRRVSLLSIPLALLMATAGSAGCHRHTTPASQSFAEAGPPNTTVTGWEGFYPPAAVKDAWLRERGIDLSAATVRGVMDRVVKLSLDDGPRSASVEQLNAMQQRYCQPAKVRAWNEDRCQALAQRRCEGDTCIYEHFGNCSGLLLGGGVLLTAAHCVAGLAEDPQRKARSAVLSPDPKGLPTRRMALGAIRIGKRDFAHHWVVVEGSDDPVDVASVRVEDGDLAHLPVGGLPDEGEPVFIVGYPRVEGRDPDHIRAAGYDLTYGTPSVSFGRLADRNKTDRPLCNVDGKQEHWALSSDCPTGPVAVEGEATWRGVITRSPFLTSYDSCNGYSGGPVFDRHGQPIGINVTLVSRTNPQERFDPSARMVAIPAERAMSKLELTPSAP